jgi:Putative restriction endonuclease
VIKPRHVAPMACLRPMRDLWTIREEKPVLIGRYWATKPDIAVLFGSDAFHATRHPRPRDVALLIEVPDTTYRRDRGQKWRRYATAGIPIFMIVRLNGPYTLVEVWTGPSGRGRMADRHAGRLSESGRSEFS